MKKVDLLIYDLDGTLIDSVQDIVSAVNFMLAELKLPKRSPEEIRGFVGEGIQSLVARSLGENNSKLAERALKVLKRYYGEHLLDHTKLYPGVLETLNHFKSKKQIVLTNKPEKFSIQVLEGLGVSSFFEMVIGGDSVRTKKPSPEGVFLALERFKILPSNSVIVGDSAIDVETGRSANITTCAVTYGLGDKKALILSNPDFSISQFRNLTLLFS